MQRTNLNLPYIPSAFAAGASTTGTSPGRTDFPQSDDTHAVVNFTDGIPPAFSDSKYLRRADLNGIGYYSTVLQYYLQCGGVVEYDEDFQDAIGGYPLGAVVRVVDVASTPPTVTTYLSITDDNTDTPPSGNWIATGLTPVSTAVQGSPNPITSGGVYAELNKNVVSSWKQLTISAGSLSYRCLDGHAVELFYTSPTSAITIGSSGSVSIDIGTSTGQLPPTYLPPAGKTVTAPFRYSYASGEGMGQSEVLYVDSPSASLSLTPASIAADSSVVSSGTIAPTSPYTSRFIWLITPSS